MNMPLADALAFWIPFALFAAFSMWLHLRMLDWERARKRRMTWADCWQWIKDGLPR